MSSFGLGERLDEVLELSNPRVFPPSTHAAAKVHIFTSISSIYTNTTAEQRTGCAGHTAADDLAAAARAAAAKSSAAAARAAAALASTHQHRLPPHRCCQASPKPR